MASLLQLVINPNPMRLCSPVDFSMQLVCLGDAKKVVVSFEYTIDVAHRRYVVPQYTSEEIDITPDSAVQYTHTLSFINTQNYKDHDLLNASLLTIRVCTPDHTVLQELICMVQPYQQSSDTPIDARIYSPY